ncbi:MAG: hypothetical protein WA139_02725 [Candidatus Aenigmatarchaeota archaeon]
MINKKTYLLAAALTFVLISGGFGMNWIINAQREDAIQKSLLNMQSSIAESQLEMDYLIGFAGGCSLLEEGKKNIAKTLIETNRKLVQYNENTIGETEIARLKTDQSVLYVKYWMFAIKMKDICKTNVSTIMYFWDISPESQQQGYVLDSISEKYGSSALVIPLDYNFDLGIIKILSRQFNVTKAPTIIINEKTKLEGPVSSAKIEKYITT